MLARLAPCAQRLMHDDIMHDISNEMVEGRTNVRWQLGENPRASQTSAPGGGGLPFSSCTLTIPNVTNS
jgi:hypothetical protein